MLSVTRQTKVPCSDEPVYTSVTLVTNVNNLPLSVVCYTGHFKAFVDILFKQRDSNLHAIDTEKKI